MEKQKTSANPYQDLLSKKDSVKTGALKLKGLNAHLQAVLQKRARLDVEVKQIQRRMKKLRSGLTVKEQKQFFSEAAGDFSPQQLALEYLSEVSYLTQYKDILDETDHLLEEVAVLPLLDFS